MQNAQIWRSIEALFDEAQTIAQSGAPMMAVVKSTPPPTAARPSDDKGSRPATGAHAVVMLQARPAPPHAILENWPADKSAGAGDANGGLTPATMADIAAAIEQVSKAPARRPTADPDQSLRDDIRQQMIGEISEAVRMVLANELPKMVRHAVSASLYELITTTTPGQMPGQIPVGDGQAAPARKAVSRKKAAKKKPEVQKTAAKKAAKPATARKKASIKTAAGKSTTRKNQAGTTLRKKAVKKATVSTTKSAKKRAGK